MRRRRPVPAGGVFGNVRTSGHLLGAIALETGRPVETAPTAQDSDYRLPNDANLEWNEGLFKTGKSVQLRGWAISWQEDLGVGACNAQMGEQLNSRGAVLEFGTRFKDGVFTLGAEKQHEEAQVQIKGGWLLPYKNTLDLDEYEQQRSVVAISNKFLVPFFAGCPHIKDVVYAVKQALCDNKYARVPRQEARALRADLLPWRLQGLLHPVAQRFCGARQHRSGAHDAHAARPWVHEHVHRWEAGDVAQAAL